MDREKPERKATDIIPLTPGSSLGAWRGPSLFDRDMDAFFDDFRKSFDVMMRPYFPGEMRIAETGLPAVRYAPLDLIDEGPHYSIHAELPGFTRDEVDVRIIGDGMSIRAQKSSEKEKKNKNYLHRERVYSSFERAVSFPEEVDPAKAEGKMNNGVLELKLPKKEPRPETKSRKLDLK